MIATALCVGDRRECVATGGATCTSAAAVSALLVLPTHSGRAVAHLGAQVARRRSCLHQRGGWAVPGGACGVLREIMSARVPLILPQRYITPRGDRGIG